MRDHSFGVGGGGGGGRASKLSKLSDLLCADPRIQSASDDDDDDDELISPTTNRSSNMTSPGYYSDQQANQEGSPYNAMSPWDPTAAAASPFVKSPWLNAPAEQDQPDAAAAAAATGLIASLVRKEGHVYSLAASGDLLYTGSESKNIRVWKRWSEFAGFKSGSGLVKAIVIADGRIFTGHQDGKIRVWKVSPTNPASHKRVGSLPRLRDYLKSSINPSNYVVVRRHRNAVWLRHFDAVSCLSLDEEDGILYSGSWDKTVKVWRISDSRCLESIAAHSDAVNAVAAAPGGVVYTGSADGTVKMWKRELAGRGRTRHVAGRTLLKQESAVTALAVVGGGAFLYSGSSDGAVNWWENGWRLAHGGVLRGHKMAVLCLSAAGSLVVSGSADKTLSVWRRGPGGEHTRLSTLSGHGGPIKCVVIEEDRDSGGEGRWFVYSGSLDRSVKVWRVSEQAKPEPSSNQLSPLHVCLPLHVTGPGSGSSGSPHRTTIGEELAFRTKFRHLAGGASWAGLKDMA